MPSTAATERRDLAFAGVARQAALVRAGEVSPRELVEVALERIAALDGDLNAFRIVFDERALLEADLTRPSTSETNAARPSPRIASSCGCCAPRARSSSA